MSSQIKGYFNPLRDLINQLKKYLSDHTLMTDLITKFVLTFGVVLIIGGLYLMLVGVTQPAQTTLAINSVLSVIDWVPGIPFYIGALSNDNAAIIGVVSWVIGLDLFLIGLGLWIRHKLARFLALAIFAIAACFQFVEFLYLGIMGSPPSIVGLCSDAIIAYFLLSKFDSQIGMKKQ